MVRLISWSRVRHSRSQKCRRIMISMKWTLTSTRLANSSGTTSHQVLRKITNTQVLVNNSRQLTREAPLICRIWHREGISSLSKITSNKQTSEIRLRQITTITKTILVGSISIRNLHQTCRSQITNSTRYHLTHNLWISLPIKLHHIIGSVNGLRRGRVKSRAR